jgi:bifunctional N-acetylglucosamine-1-phosphate-uridyltransferase/glucosamine-1-phosphate-acetyltransferase GlmU-like protein
VSTVLIVPAAGLGSRLGAPVPKLLAPVNGRPMIDHVLALHRPWADRAAIVVHPSAYDAVRRHFARRPDIPDLFVQEELTGMLDAILLARAAVERWTPRRVRVTWCDQIAVRPETVERVARAASADPEPDLVAVTCVADDPYIHFERDASGRIARVLQRREGDAMPPRGESDTGLFDLSRATYLERLPQYAASPHVGAGTGERNFVPFVPWLSARGTVVTVPCVETAERVGINTPEELAFVARVLRERGHDA